MGERTIDQMLQRIVNDSGLKLDISPHTLRHNSATMCAKAGFSEAMLRLRFGWSKSSPMPSKYTHLVDKDLDDKIKKIKGITEDDKPEVSVLQPIVCWNCQQENPCSNVFCSRCGSKLTRTKEDVATAVDIGVLLQKAEASDPKIKEMLEPIIREQLIKLLQEDKKKKA
jgi:ribosomal protein L40E